MSKDKHVTMKFKSDTKEAEKGINNISDQLNQFAKNVTKASKPIVNLLDSFNTVGKSFGFIKSALSSAKAAIADVTNAFNAQATAEKQLEAAAKNNPYLSDYSVDQLKKYAGELQSISTVGDEELLPMMAQLAASGRTQAEIQDIMSTALDVSASEAMDLNTAVKQLNATYSGSVGQLGKVNSSLKSLSKKELQNGEAVKIMKEQYAGIVKTVSDSTGGWQKFKNSFGDFKEILGNGFTNIQNSTGKILSNFFDTITSKIKSAGEEADEFKKKLHFDDLIKTDKLSVADAQQAVEYYTKELELAENIQKAVQEGQDGFSKSQKEVWKNAESNYNQEIKKLEEIQRAAEITRQSLESNRSNDLLNSSGAEETAEIYKKYADSLVDAGEAYNHAKVNADKYRESEKKNVDELKEKYDESATEYLSLIDIFNTKWQQSETRLGDYVKETTKNLKKAKEDFAEAQKEAAKGTVSEADQKALEIITKNNAELQKQLTAIEQKYSLMEKEGQKIDEIAKSQEILSAQENAYLKLISEDTTLVTQNNAVAKARLAEIKTSYEQVTEAIKKKVEAEKDKEAFKALKTETEQLTEEAKKFAEVTKELKLSEQITASITKLKEMQASTQEGSEEWEYYNAKIKELTGLLDVVKQKEAEIAESSYTSDLQKWAQVHEKKLEVVSNFASKYAEIMSSITDMVKTQVENEAKVKQSALEKQLAAGEISEEEYAERKEEIEKEAAKKTYEIQMWEWSASLLNIGVQTALAVMQALSSMPPVVGIPMAALMGTLGAVQLATAIANKPIPPSFATGGVIGGFQGASMGGDNTYAHVRNGEMILNAKQQKAMFDQLNGYSGNTGSLTNNVVVKNYAAGNVAVTQVPKSDGFELVIKETVRKQLAAGDYSSQLKTAQTKIDGIRYV